MAATAQRRLIPSDALRAEWTKLRTLASTAWLVSAAAVLTVGLSAAVLVSSKYQPDSYQDLPKLALTGIDLGQAVVAILAVLTISNEYSTGMVRVTLVAMPRRLALLAAKTAIVTSITAVAGAVAVGGCLLLGRVVPPGNGFTAAHGYQLLSLGDGATWRAAVGSVLYLALIALLSLGVATAIRDSATSIGVVLALLYLFPLLAQVVSDPAWHRHLEQIGPMTAGLSIEATVGVTGLPISPWAGLGVLALWAGGALLAGGAAFCLRDA